MDALVSVTDDDEALRALLAWLKQEDELRGRVRMAPTTPAPGEMGAITDTLTVALGGGGAVTVLLTSVSSWMRSRRSDVSVEVTVGERKVALEAKRVKAGPDELRELIESATQALDPDEPEQG